MKVPSAIPLPDDSPAPAWFLNPSDFVAILAPWGKPCPVEANVSLDALLAGHVLRRGSARGEGPVRDAARDLVLRPGAD